MNLIYFFGIPVFDDGSKAIKHDGDLRKAFNKFLFWESGPKLIMDSGADMDGLPAGGG